ncbi:MAG: protein kinase [Thermoanaerobaculia bacterium]
MGEVYRARDERLKRDVAIKVLPASFSENADRLRRFEQEAQAAGALNHPNITAVHDIGTNPSDGAPYIVTELLEGETLRSRLSGGALSVRKCLDYAVQIAHGLAAAHEKGIIHRDLKPENLFVTKDGRVKILDFGLAKLTESESGVSQQSGLPTQTAGTEPGVVMGTLGYMSPEQVRGKPADARSDIFSFGSVLYEMLSGLRAFQRDSAADTMSAILREEPPDLSATNQNIHPAVDRIVRHCLEKNPEERFHSAHDLAFDIEAISGVSGERAVSAAGAKRRFPAWALVAAAAVAAALVTHFAERALVRVPPPSFHQLTFRRGQIFSARFDPEGKTVAYTASWEGGPMEIYVVRPDAPESKPFGLAGAEVLAISKSGEMAVSRNRHVPFQFQRIGTLARLPISGGAAPRDILDDVEWADWAPDGKSLAVLRVIPGRMRLEYPVGKTLYETGAWMNNPRVSPDGERVAFVDHPTAGDTGGSIAVVDRSGRKTTISRFFESAEGLAWSPRGEIWFTAAVTGTNQALWSATLRGSVQLRARIPGALLLHDISREGRLLVTRMAPRSEIMGLAPGESKERDLTWLDWSVPAAISRDGKTLLFSESGQGGGTGYSVYIRKMDGSPAVRLGEGAAGDLSPDGRWALSIAHLVTDPQIVAYPTGAGEPIVFPRQGVSAVNATFLPDGKRMLVSASEPGHGLRLYLRDFPGGASRALSPEGYFTLYGVSPNEQWAAAVGPDRKTVLYPIAGGEPRIVPGMGPNEGVAQFCGDSRCLYVYRQGEAPANVYKLDIATGRRELWRTLMPADATGVSEISPLVNPNGDAYVYRFFRAPGDLYIMDGVR